VKIRLDTLDWICERNVRFNMYLYSAINKLSKFRVSEHWVTFKKHCLIQRTSEHRFYLEDFGGEIWC
jgi:hypothetical protein